ncbi:hypothetical protein ACQP10_34670 [Streptosporangium sandarakinum]|uniref:hypothetical protein n=1 Tax=Streptosporangium sandarakinum TaxID=1260955 RepID=UPI003D9311E6
MIDTARTSPRQVRITIALLWSVVPHGLAVTVLNGVALVMTDRRLPHAPVTQNAEAVPVALREYAGFAWGRTALIGLFFVAAALAFGLLARAAWQGARRWPAVPLLAGVLAVLHTIGLVLVAGLNPVTGYGPRLFPVNGALFSGAPFDMAAAAPPWYLPALAALLVLGWAGQLAGLILLARPATVRWYTRKETAGEAAGDTAAPAEDTTGEPAVPAGRTRAIPLMALGPVFVAVVTAFNHTAIRLTENAADPALVEHVVSAARTAMFVDSAFLGVPAVALAILGTHPRLRTRPGALLTSGVLTVLYLLALVVAQVYNPLSTGVLTDDQSGFSEHIPPWYLPALTIIQSIAALVHLAALAELVTRARGPLIARSPSCPPSTTSRRPGPRR